MADLFSNPYYSFFYPSTIEGINALFGNKLEQRYKVKFIPPRYTVHFVLNTANHPNGGQMNNWSRLASADDINHLRIVQNLRAKDFMYTFDPKLKLEDYGKNEMEMFVNPFNYRMLPYVKRHEYKHIVNHAVPYNIANLYAIKKYNQMRDWGYFKNPTDSLHQEILADSVKKWLDSPMRQLPLPFMGNGINYYHTRRQILKRLTTDLDKKLDRHENEQNLYYTNVPLDDDWLSIYGWFLPDM